MNQESQSIGGPSDMVVRVLRRILRPLVRFMLSQGITYPLLSELLKLVYVQVASEEFTLERKRQTDSRISLLSGVHRKDVKRLMPQIQEQALPPANVSLGAQLVARWVSQKEYLDKRGKPAPLARLASDGGAMSFEALVASVSKDIRSRAILDEWLRLGVVHLDEQDRVCLNVDAFVPKKGFEEKAFYFGQNLHDHIAASVSNVLELGAPFLERSVYYDQLTKASTAELAQLSAELGMQALQTINRRAIELEARDNGKPEAQQRMNFGIYFFTTAREQESPTTAEPNSKLPVTRR
jgi:Family of unknown function (DUF6502)